MYKLAELELHHGGSIERAVQLLEAAAALPPREAAVAISSYLLSLLLTLTRRCDEAVPHLARLGFRHRLAPAVWAAVTVPPPEPPPPARPLVTRFSDAVPPALLRQLKHAFGPSSPFWTESNYKQRGYFSF